MRSALAVLLAMAGVTASDERREDAPAAATVVFVCEHGSVKSLIAQEWFNRLARERGLPVRGVSLGVTPDAAVPGAIAAALEKDGFDVRGFTPRHAEAAALRDASRIVVIGGDRGALPVTPDVAVESWDGVPPASRQYETARDAIKARIEALLADLALAPRP